MSLELRVEWRPYGYAVYDEDDNRLGGYSSLEEIKLDYPNAELWGDC